jgi:threonyl-tRNA synthetase
MNITDAQANAVEKITLTLRKLGLRVEEDLRNEKIGFKIREHSIQRVPYLLIVGDREATSGQVAVRTREGTDLGVMSVQDFSERILAEVARHSHEIGLEE